MMKNKLTIPAILFFVLMIAGCGGQDNPQEDDTPTQGKIKVCVDETFAHVISSQAETFEKIYTEAKLNISYKSEAQAVNDLLSDSARLIIIPRKLTSEERSYFDKQKIIPTERRVCIDAIAVIVNNDNRDTLMTMQNFRDIMSGKVTSWNQVDPKSGLSKIQIVFDNPNSSTVRYVRDKINGQLSKSSYAVNNNSAVVDYVSKNKNAVGVIGVNWISDKDDSLTHRFLSKIKVVGLSADSLKNPSIDDYYQPYQAYIAQKTYPLIREVYMITGEARAGLASGFIAFVASERGQRIFLKAGLVPATAPIRLVEINKGNIKITK
jgi:phosphate transport system substrate-binding protein